MAATAVIKVLTVPSQALQSAMPGMSAAMADDAAGLAHRAAANGQVQAHMVFGKQGFAANLRLAELDWQQRHVIRGWQGLTSQALQLAMPGMSAAIALTTCWWCSETGFDGQSSIAAMVFVASKRALRRLQPDRLWMTAAALSLMGLTDMAVGAPVSDAGDVNGDGFDDLLIGAPKTELLVCSLLAKANAGVWQTEGLLTEKKQLNS